MENANCPDCRERQWSIDDREYVALFHTCWSCDKKRWEQGLFSTEEFEKRELEASKSNLTLKT
jgi:hypothetical protein